MAFLLLHIIYIFILNVIIALSSQIHLDLALGLGCSLGKAKTAEDLSPLLDLEGTPTQPGY